MPTLMPSVLDALITQLELGNASFEDLPESTRQALLDYGYTPPDNAGSDAGGTGGTTGGTDGSTDGSTDGDTGGATGGVSFEDWAEETYGGDGTTVGASQEDFGDEVTDSAQDVQENIHDVIDDLTGGVGTEEDIDNLGWNLVSYDDWLVNIYGKGVDPRTTEQDITDMDRREDHYDALYEALDDGTIDPATVPEHLKDAIGWEDAPDTGDGNDGGTGVEDGQGGTEEVYTPETVPEEWKDKVYDVLGQIGDILQPTLPPATTPGTLNLPPWLPTPSVTVSTQPGGNKQLILKIPGPFGDGVIEIPMQENGEYVIVDAVKDKLGEWGQQILDIPQQVIEEVQGILDGVVEAGQEIGDIWSDGDGNILVDIIDTAGTILDTVLVPTATVLGSAGVDPTIMPNTTKVLIVDAVIDSVLGGDNGGGGTDSGTGGNDGTGGNAPTDSGTPSTGSGGEPPGGGLPGGEEVDPTEYTPGEEQPPLPPGEGATWEDETAQDPIYPDEDGFSPSVTDTPLPPGGGATWEDETAQDPIYPDEDGFMPGTGGADDWVDGGPSPEDDEFTSGNTGGTDDEFSPGTAGGGGSGGLGLNRRQATVEAEEPDPIKYFYDVYGGSIFPPGTGGNVENRLMAILKQYLPDTMRTNNAGSPLVSPVTGANIYYPDTKDTDKKARGGPVKRSFEDRLDQIMRGYK